MKAVRNLLIDDFNIRELGMDFMGYEVFEDSSLDFHHLLIPRRICVNIPGFGSGYTYENGCILLHNSSHPYLHLIENIDRDKFLMITSEIYDMKVKGKLDMDNIRFINDILCDFEYSFRNKKNHKGEDIIKPKFKRRVLTK